MQLLLLELELCIFFASHPVRCNFIRAESAAMSSAAHSHTFSIVQLATLVVAFEQCQWRKYVLILCVSLRKCIGRNFAQLGIGYAATHHHHRISKSIAANDVKWKKNYVQFVRTQREFYTFVFHCSAPFLNPQKIAGICVGVLFLALAGLV